jgi:hypothetical protein
MIQDFDELGTALDNAAETFVASSCEALKNVLVTQVEQQLNDQLAAKGISAEQLSTVNVEELKSKLPLGVTLPENLDLSDVSTTAKQIVNDLNVSEVIQKAKANCNITPNATGCDLVEKLNISNNKQFQEAIETSKMIDGYINYGIIFAFILIFISVGLFLFVNQPEWKYALYRIGLSIAVAGSALAIAFYFLPSTLESVINNDALINQISQLSTSMSANAPQISASVLDGLKGVILNLIMSWIDGPVQKILWVSLALVVIGLSLAVTFFILYRKSVPKDLNKPNSKGSKNDK